MADSLAASSTARDHPGFEPEPAGVVLAAGAGTRLVPLSLLRPKALCPVGDRPLVDHALAHVGAVVADVAVNVHHGRDQMEEHLARWSDRAGRDLVISLERDRPLGTAGAIARLQPWLAGRPVLVANADTWHRADLSVLLAGWDDERVRVLTTTGGPFRGGSLVVASLIPGALARGLAPTRGAEVEPAGLWEVLWRGEVQAGRLETLHADAVAVDCGTSAEYLRANMAWSALVGDGGSVIGEGAVVDGTLERCVVWPGSRVLAGEHLRDAIRADHLTVLVR